MNPIIDQWIEGKVPILNGVVEVSGRVHLVRPVDPPRSLPMTLQGNGLTKSALLPAITWSTVIPAITVHDARIATSRHRW